MLVVIGDESDAECEIVLVKFPRLNVVMGKREVGRGQRVERRSTKASARSLMKLNPAMAFLLRPLRFLE